MRHVPGLKRTPTFQAVPLFQSLERKLLATSEMRPVNGLGWSWLRARITRPRRYSTPAPTAKTPLVLCQATAGSTERTLMFASREEKRPIHGSSQLVRRPYGVITPTPKVRLLPMGTMAYALGGTKVCRL